MDKLFEATVAEMALSDELATEKPTSQTLVSNFLHKHFIVGNAQSKRCSLPVEVIGAAIERAGKLVDALQYYRSMFNKEKDPQKQEFLAQRLVSNLEKYAKFSKQRHDPKAEEREKEALSLRKNTNWETEISQNIR